MSLKNIFDKSNSVTPEIGSKLILKFKKVYSAVDDEKGKMVPYMECYLYDTTPIKGRYAISDEKGKCGRIPHSITITGWISDSDMKNSIV